MNIYDYRLLSLFIFLLTTSSLQAQLQYNFCDTENCKTLMRHITRAKDLETEKNKLQRQLENKNLKVIDLNNQIENSSKNSSEMDYLKAERYYLHEQLDNLKNDYETIQNRQNTLLTKIEKLEEQFRDEVNRNVRLRDEVRGLFDLLKITSEELIYTKENITRILFLDSYINDYAIGYAKGNEVVYAERVSSGGKRESIKVGFGKKMTHIEARGILTQLNGDSSHDPILIEGYLLIYVDGKLFDKVDSEMNRVHQEFIPGFRRYELKASNLKLNNSVKEGNDIKIGFIDKSTYDRTSKKILSDYVEATTNKIFIITNNEPTPFEYYTDKKNIDLLSENIHVVTSPNFILEIYDEANVDGDIVNINFNDDNIFSNLQLSGKNDSFIIKDQLLSRGDNIIFFEVVSEGSQEPCTVEYELLDKEGKLLAKSKLFGKIGTKSPGIIVKYIPKI